jgi:hypothetical protein
VLSDEVVRMDDAAWQACYAQLAAMRLPPVGQGRAEPAAYPRSGLSAVVAAAAATPPPPPSQRVYQKSGLAGSTAQQPRQAQQQPCSTEELDEWLSHQRGLAMLGMLRSDRRRALDALCVTWVHMRDEATRLWDRRLSELLAYKAEHGNCDVSSSVVRCTCMFD